MDVLHFDDRIIINEYKPQDPIHGDTSRYRYSSSGICTSMHSAQIYIRRQRAWRLRDMSAMRWTHLQSLRKRVRCSFSFSLFLSFLSTSKISISRELRHDAAGCASAEIPRNPSCDNAILTNNKRRRESNPGHATRLRNREKPASILATTTKFLGGDAPRCSFPSTPALVEARRRCNATVNSAGNLSRSKNEQRNKKYIAGLRVSSRRTIYDTER